MTAFNGTNTLSSAWLWDENKGKSMLIRSAYIGPNLHYPGAVIDYAGQYFMDNQHALYLPNLSTTVYQEKEVAIPVQDKSTSLSAMFSVFFPNGLARGIEVKETGEYVFYYTSSLLDTGSGTTSRQLYWIVLRGGLYALADAGVYIGSNYVNAVGKLTLVADDLIGWCWGNNLQTARFEQPCFGISKN